VFVFGFMSTKRLKTNTNKVNCMSFYISYLSVVSFAES
jgi:hypothetical protein